MTQDKVKAGLDWQTDTWDQMAKLYATENAPRMAPVAERAIEHASPKAGERVLDLGTGTGIVMEKCLQIVGSDGHVTGTDISKEMLEHAQNKLGNLGYSNFSLLEGGGELIPVRGESIDVIIASLSFMYMVDRAATAREMYRVLRSKGRFVGAVWAGPKLCDLVRFQQIAGSYSDAPPVPGVGPGALADPTEFLQQLSDVGFTVHVETENLGFDIDSFALTWDVFAGVTTARLSSELKQKAKEAVMAEMWPDGEGPRHFNNRTQFIIGSK